MANEPRQIPAEEHQLHMWEPLKFEIPEDYDYQRRAWYKRLGSILFRGIVTIILAVYNYLALGVHIEGRENVRALKGRGAVAVCNHVHPMDCTLVDNAVLPKRVYYVTLDTNFRIPLVRHIIRWLGGVPMSRSPRQILTLFSQMEEAMARGAVVQVYPEGVLVPYDGQLRNFHNGAFRMAVEAGVPVLPMVITQEPPRGFFRLYKRKPCLRLHILPPVEADPGLTRREAIAWLNNAARSAMTACLENAKTSGNFEKIS